MGFVSTQTDSLALRKGMHLWRQTYDKDSLPEGVRLFKLSVFADDQGGWFKENLRLDEKGLVIALKEQGTDFGVKQSNSSQIAPGGKRFWHIHPVKKNHPGQNEMWATTGTLLVGLVDLRQDSSTVGTRSKVVLSVDRALYIPAGVAHGFINPNASAVTLVYFTDQHFSADEDTQEHRIDPRELPFDFVEPETM